MSAQKEPSFYTSHILRGIIVGALASIGSRWAIGVAVGIVVIDGFVWFERLVRAAARRLQADARGQQS